MTQPSTTLETFDASGVAGAVVVVVGVVVVVAGIVVVSLVLELALLVCGVV